MKHPNIPNPLGFLGKTFNGGSPEELENILENASKWAMLAGKLQLEKFRNRHMLMETKTSKHDLVTEVDRASEALLIKCISEEYPNHSILGEESGAHTKASDWEWVIDPLDGTNNYSQGLPIFSVSIGVKHNGQTVVGVVYLPYLDEIFSAIRGRGAFWNGSTIRVSHKRDLNECLVATGFPYDKGTSTDNNLNNVAALLPHLRGLRRMGSAAYDLCCVAAGLLDGYWELNLKPWDVCAGSLIVEEAGGIVKPFRCDRNISIVAGHSEVVEMIYEKLEKK